jgi:hypothetical protein
MRPIDSRLSRSTGKNPARTARAAASAHLATPATTSLQKESPVLKVLSITVCAALSMTACVASDVEEQDEDEDELESTADELQSSPFVRRNMKLIARPSGMPAPWAQPDPTGQFGQNGKCGATAVANTLRLYGIEVSPQKAEDNGVRWFIGATTRQIEPYFDKHHPRLGCSTEHPEDGAAFLRREIRAGHPVMVWYNVEGTLSSHWVTAVGVRGSGASEEAIVISWGKYFAMPMKALVDAWRQVYGQRHPSVVCDATTKMVVTR